MRTDNEYKIRVRGRTAVQMHRLFTIGTLAFLCLAAPPLAAHHSVPVNFDQSREVTIEGILTEIKWINPHSRFRVDVSSPDGTTIEWLVEMGAANTMRRAGFPMERFEVGQRVAITGAPGRRERAVLLREVLMPDGTRLNPDMRERGGATAP
jgi:hypothetical protein